MSITQKQIEEKFKVLEGRPLYDEFKSKMFGFLNGLDKQGQAVKYPIGPSGWQIVVEE